MNDNQTKIDNKTVSVAAAFGFLLFIIIIITLGSPRNTINKNTNKQTIKTGLVDKISDIDYKLSVNNTYTNDILSFDLGKDNITITINKIDNLNYYSTLKLNDNQITFDNFDGDYYLNKNDIPKISIVNNYVIFEQNLPLEYYGRKIIYVTDKSGNIINKFDTIGNDGLVVKDYEVNEEGLTIYAENILIDYNEYNNEDEPINATYYYRFNNGILDTSNPEITVTKTYAQSKIEYENNYTE